MMLKTEENKQPLLPRDDKTFFVLTNKGFYAIARYDNYPEQEFLGIDEEYLKRVQLMESLIKSELSLEDDEFEIQSETEIEI